MSIYSKQSPTHLHGARAVHHVQPHGAHLGHVRRHEVVPAGGGREGEGAGGRLCAWDLGSGCPCPRGCLRAWVLPACVGTARMGSALNTACPEAFMHPSLRHHTHTHTHAHTRMLTHTHTQRPSGLPAGGWPPTLPSSQGTAADARCQPRACAAPTQHCAPGALSTPTCPLA